MNLYKGNVAGAVRRFGKPQCTQDAPDSQYPGSGERTYHWNRNAVRLQIGTEYRKDAKRRRVIESPATVVDVWGDSSDDRMGATGAGLRLGQTLADVIRIYGSGFERTDKSVLIQWRDETTMVLDFNDSGRIIHIHLEASVE